MKLIPFVNQMLLVESKRDEVAIVKKYRIDHSYWQIIRTMDPSRTKKYSKYMLLMFGKGKLDPFELSDPQSNILNSKKLRQFHEMGDRVDFSHFKSWDEFKKWMEPYVDWVGKHEMKLVSSDPNAASIVLNNDKCFVVKLKSKAAACMYGAGTFWCVSQKDKNFFMQYNAGSVLYEIVSRIYPHNADNPILYKLMVMVPRNSGEQTYVTIVTANNKDHTVTISEEGKATVTSGPHYRELQEYIDKLNIDWKEILYENIKNYNINDDILEDGTLPIKQSVLNYLKRNGYTDFSFLNRDDLRIDSEYLQYIKSFKGIKSIYMTNDIYFSNIDKTELETTKIPSIDSRGYDLRIRFDGNQYATFDASILSKFTSVNAAGNTIYIITNPYAKLINLPSDDDLKYSVYFLSALTVSSDENIEDSKKIKFAALQRLTDNDTTLSIKTESSTMKLYNFTGLPNTIKNINVEYTRGAREGFTIIADQSPFKDININFLTDMYRVRIDYCYSNISFNPNSNARIKELKIVQEGDPAVTVTVNNADIVRIYYAIDTTLISNSDIETLQLYDCRKIDLSGTSRVKNLRIGGCRVIEYPKQTDTAMFEYMEGLKFKKQDFNITKMVFEGYDSKEFFNYLLTLPFIPQIDPPLSTSEKEELIKSFNKRFPEKAIAAVKKSRTSPRTSKGRTAAVDTFSNKPNVNLKNNYKDYNRRKI